MPRPIWKGAISFSMVTIPIKLYSATEEKDVRFNMLHATDHSRIKQKRFCAEEDIEVDNEAGALRTAGGEKVHDALGCHLNSLITRL